MFDFSGDFLLMLAGCGSYAASIVIIRRSEGRRDLHLFRTLYIVAGCLTFVLLDVNIVIDNETDIWIFHSGRAIIEDR